jgi:O-antigen ligase
MQKVKQQSKSTDASPVRWIFGGLAVITLYFQTNLNDPFNSPKMWILAFMAAWLIGYIISFKRIILINKNLKTLFFILVSFTGSALLASVFTDFKYVAVFGETQRRNGLISYLSLAIVLFATSIFVRIFNIKKLYTTTYFVGVITAIYAFMQTNGKDFVKWNNNYNSIIGTLGNPNFAAAVMAIMGVLIFASIFFTDFKIYIRFFAAALAIVLFGLIYRSNARQGLLSYILGVGLFLIVWLYIKNRKLGIIAASSGVIVFIFSILGMLQIGPFERFLYKPSVSVRGHYWRTGIEMFKNDPLFGVGMDRYGAYFKEFREVSYSLSYGFDITSSNAHNTFIQFFATGGVFLGLSYLILNSYILKRAIFGLKNLSGNNQLLLAGIFSAWIAFHAQSLVSIDNIGISIWGWVLGGSIIGLSISSNTEIGEDRRQFLGKQNDVNLSRALVSGTFGLVVIVLVALLFRGEVNTYNARGSYNLDNAAAVESYKMLQLNSINTVLNDPSYSLYSAMNLAENGFIDEGVEIITRLHINDPRNLDAINALALINESVNKIPDAIEYRLKIAKLDPWNPVNYLQLGKDYKAQGDSMKSKEMLDKILSFSTGVVGDPIAEQAKKELSQ